MEKMLKTKEELIKCGSEFPEFILNKQEELIEQAQDKINKRLEVIYADCVAFRERLDEDYHENKEDT